MANRTPRRETRQWLAQFLRSSSASPDALVFFAKSDDWLLRSSAAASPSMPRRLLERLARDEDDRVVESAVTNPALSYKTLSAIARTADAHKGTRRVWAALARRAQADLSQFAPDDPREHAAWVVAQDAELALVMRSWKAAV